LLIRKNKIYKPHQGHTRQRSADVYNKAKPKAKPEPKPRKSVGEEEKKKKPKLPKRSPVMTSPNKKVQETQASPKPKWKSPPGPTASPVKEENIKIYEPKGIKPEVEEANYQKKKRKY